MGSPVIEAVGLARTFPTPAGTVHALTEASLSVEIGEVALIMGRSGSGKSTLLHLLGLMDRPSSGTLHLGGQDVLRAGDKARDRLRVQHLGFVFQGFHLVEHRTVRQNVTMPLMYAHCPARERGPKAAAALNGVAMTHRIDALPPTLSGGEKQRVAIARAMVHSPRVLLCDEPTGNLDQGNAERVLAILRAAADRGIAVVIVSHDASIAALADTVYTMLDGVLSPAAHGVR